MTWFVASLILTAWLANTAWHVRIERARNTDLLNRLSARSYAEYRVHTDPVASAPVRDERIVTDDTGLIVSYEDDTN